MRECCIVYRLCGIPVSVKFNNLSKGRGCLRRGWKEVGLNLTQREYLEEGAIVVIRCCIQYSLYCCSLDITRVIKSIWRNGQTSMNEIRDRWKGRGRMVDLNVNGRLTEICHEETVCKAVKWISPERDTVVAGFLGAFAKLPKSDYSFVMSVRPSALNSLPPSGRIFIKFGTWVFLENLSRKLVSLKSEKNNGYFNPLNPELNPICYLLALLGAHHFLHVSRIRVKLLTFRLLMAYIYIWSTHSWCF